MVLGKNAIQKAGGCMEAINESILSLKRNLGLTEDEAKELLDIPVTIKITNRHEFKFLERFLILMLSKTFNNVTVTKSEIKSNFIEVTVESITRSSVFICNNDNVTEISLEVPRRTSHLALHPAFQLLTAAYATGAVVVQSTKEKKIGRGERYPITLNWKKMFGEDLSFLDQETYLGDFNVAGLGATGTWLVKAFEHMNLTGNIYGFDDDHVSKGNLQRTTYSECDVEKYKAIALEDSFAPINQKLKFIPINSKFPNSCSLHENVSTCVDSRVARRNIQDEMPYRTFDCSTTDISEVSLFFGELHKDKACLGCLYYKENFEEATLIDMSSALGVPIELLRIGHINEASSELIKQKYPDIDCKEIIGIPYDSFVKELCGQGKLAPSDEINLEDVNIAPLCHVSAIAGIFLAIEIKRRFHLNFKSVEWNYWKINPWTTPRMRNKVILPVNHKCSFHKNEIDTAIMIWNKSKVIISNENKRPLELQS